MKLTFDDVLIEPGFSYIESRRDVILTQEIFGSKYELPVISANMTSVTGPEMHDALSVAGGVGCLHRFGSIQETINQFKKAYLLARKKPFISVGIGSLELERAESLIDAGAEVIVIDVAHGAQMSVVKQVNAIRDLKKPVFLIVGNFASASSFSAFKYHSNDIDALKIGIGPGAACTTRLKTGVGYPQLSAIMDIHAEFPNMPLIADGGIKTPGDVAKAIGGGADMVMMGSMLAGTDEAPGEVILDQSNYTKYKIYSGSASKESYATQNKDDSWRTAEGETFRIKYKGPVSAILKDIEGGLRSAMTYVGAKNIRNFQQNCHFVEVSSATIIENGVRK